MKENRKLKIRVSFFAILMLLVLVLSHSYISLAALIAAALHELGHIVAARICKAPLDELKLGIFGASLFTKKEIGSYKDELTIALAGPAVNLICAAFIMLFGKSTGEFGQMFLAGSLFLGILNLLPITDFDGGRVLFCLVALKYSLNSARSLLRISSFLLIFVLWSLSVYLILRLGASLSLFVFSASLFCKIFIGNSGKN